MDDELIEMFQTIPFSPGNVTLAGALFCNGLPVTSHGPVTELRTRFLVKFHRHNSGDEALCALWFLVYVVFQ